MFSLSHFAGRARIVIDRLRLRELAVLVSLLLISVGAWGFIELADEVVEGDTQQFDEWVVRSLRRADDLSMPVGPEWLRAAGRDITSLGSASVLMVVIGAVAGYLLLRRKYHAMWLVLGATLSGELLSALLKNSFERERPSIVPHLDQVATASFPSGHSMLSAVVYLTLGALLMRLTSSRVAKAYILGCALGLAILIGLTRVYLGVHYPTDVLAGWSAGLVWAVLWWLIARYLQRHGAVEKEE